jgi:hypothetical protein
MRLEYIEFKSGDIMRRGLVAPKRIDTDISIEDARISDGNHLTIDFAYTALYDPDNSHIKMRGVAGFLGDDAKALLNKWKKSGNMEGDSGLMVLNAINYHASMNSVLIVKSFNMVPPIMLPEISFGGKKASAPKKSKKAKSKKKTGKTKAKTKSKKGRK